jgi:hypothetical protein
MGDMDEDKEEKPYKAEYAKSGRSKCQACGQTIEKVCPAPLL